MHISNDWVERVPGPRTQDSPRRFILVVISRVSGLGLRVQGLG